MKLLLHVCCAPCTVYPLKELRKKSVEVMGFFYRHNIHPYTECRKRQKSLEEFAETVNLRVIYQKGYDLEGFLRKAAFRESNRCMQCYYDRLRTTAKMAKKGRFDNFSTTLLYSKYQNHDAIRSIGESIGKKVGVPFHYADYRIGWKEGVETSKQMEMYRQQYCGCIYSEKERFFAD